MSHHTLYTIATERYIALRQEADGSRLGSQHQAHAVPSAPPAPIRRLAAWIASIVRAPRWRASSAGSTLPEQPIRA